MGGAALVAAFLAAAPVKNLDVRVKSKHDKVVAEAGGVSCLKLGPEEVLRGAAIGPGSVRVSLRRLAAPGAKPVSVKVTRDGRDVALLSLAGKGVQAFEGELALAAAPVERALDIPSGPHTLFVEVGPGVGHVLVAFNEPASSAAAAAARKPAGAPASAPAGAAEASAAAQAKAPSPSAPKDPEAKKRLPADVRVASTAAKPTSPRPRPGEPPPAGPKAVSPPAVAREEAQGVAPAEAGRPEAQGAAAAPLAAAGPEPTSASLDPSAGGRVPAVVEPVEGAGTASASPGASEPIPSRPRRFLLGVRAGGTGQIQLGALGPAAGVSARCQVLGASSSEATAGLLLGLSADYLRYRFALDLGSDRGQAARMQDLVLANIPILAEALWSFGRLTRWRIVPSLGATAGVSLSTASGQGSVGAIHQTEARPAVGAVAGLELPLASGRLGAELRYLHSTTGSTGAARNFQVGGALFQATWRFGL